MIGLEVAEYLAARGHFVNIMEILESVVSFFTKPMNGGFLV